MRHISMVADQEENRKAMNVGYDAKPGTSKYSVANVPYEDTVAIPLQIQRLEKLLVLHPYLNYCEQLFRSCRELSDHNYVKVEPESVTSQPSIVEAKAEEKAQEEKFRLLAEEKPKVYNFEKVGKNRKWLQDLLLSISSDEESGVEDDEIEYMKECQHMRSICKQKYRSKPEFFSQFKYYGAGLLSAYDRYTEPSEERVPALASSPIKEHVPVCPPTPTQKPEKSSRKQHLQPRQLMDKEPPKPQIDDRWRNNNPVAKALNSFSPGGVGFKPGISSIPEPGPKKRGRKRKELSDDVESLGIQRRKIWCLQCMKEVKKMQKAILGAKKENLIVLKRLAVGCARIVRQKALQSEKSMKETTWRCKRISKEVQAFWKRNDKVEKTQRKQAEQEAREQRRQDLEILEAKRQQRKLNFLITQTELYAHFMSRKLGGTDPNEEGKILNNLEEEKNARLQEIDTYDSQAAKQQLLRSVSTAFRSQQVQTRKFDTEVSADVPEYAATISDAITHKEAEHSQPANFQGKLKSYQLKGMNWIASIYNQGINGILADEMGLGKTVQSISFLAHVAEKYGIWGPFLIISPTSTLHNWQQEFARFVPDFKVVPYWGSPQERKILRQFWNTKNLHTKESSFHVVITSYQMIVTDYKYFQRLKWQYMVLDEAQAIKSSSSARWKTLLGFNCRNRLLLSGTPIQNNMAELWALLHFIMPTLFDSHDEFNEWFSKDIEGMAENKGSRNIDEKHLTRLHLILKPFMLRRIKKDVENELSEKIEVMMYCPLTLRQKALYDAVKKKIRIEDLLYSGNSSSTSSVASNLMNIVMQLRKVCNHPELFERRDVKSPFYAKIPEYELPKLVFREGLLASSLPSKRHILEGKLTVWNSEWIERSFTNGKQVQCKSEFSFLRFSGLSVGELVKIIFGGVLAKLKQYIKYLEQSPLIFYQNTWDDQIRPLRSRSLLLDPNFKLSPQTVITSPVMESLIFTSVACTVHSFGDVLVKPMRETIEHRMMRTRKHRKSLRVRGYLEASDDLLPEVTPVDRKPEIHRGCWLELPSFLYQPCVKATASFCGVYCSDRSASWWMESHNRCSTAEALDVVLRGAVRSPTRINVSFAPAQTGGITSLMPKHGWSSFVSPDKDSLVGDSGKMRALDSLLKRLKEGGHRVLIYSQMTRVIDLLEEYLRYRNLTYIRLDGSSRIEQRRDMVADFQSRSDIFVFLLSTRAGGLGINLTAADTVIFYDSDWNPTVDEQAMDRAHRLGQTKQVTVYRLICKGTVEERILQRAREKSEIQRMVISGGQFKPDSAALKPKEVVSLLLEDDELERKYRQRRIDEEGKEGKKRKGTKNDTAAAGPPDLKKVKVEPELKPMTKEENGIYSLGKHIQSAPGSPARSELSVTSSTLLQVDDDSNDVSLTAEDTPSRPLSPLFKSSSISKTYSSSNLEFDVSPLLPGLSLRSRPFKVRGTGRRGRPAARRGRGQSRGALAVRPEPLDSDEEEILRIRSEPSRRGPGRPRTKPPAPANLVPRTRGRPRGSTAKVPPGTVSTSQPRPNHTFPPPVLNHSGSFSRLSDDEDEF